MTLAHCTTHYTSLGTGSTAVFLLHGVGGGHSTWAATQAALAQHGYQAVAWDMPGYGSSATITPYTTAALAQSLHQLIAHIGAQRNVLLGHSMGGMVAQEALALGAQHNHTIDAAIFYATSPAFGKPGGDWQQQFLNDRFAPLDAGKGMATLARDVVLSMFAHSDLSSLPSNQPLQQAIATAQHSMAAVPEATYRAALSAIVSFNQLANLPHIDIPTLCLAAEHDRNAPRAVMQKMAAHIANAHYTCLPDCGHLAHMEQPDIFNHAVLSFLQQHVAHGEPPMHALG
jgi:3-oxoadipate enol-lactonase